MCEAYGHCEIAARDAGQKQKEEMYRKKSLEAAAAISKIWERDLIKDKQEEEAKRKADLKGMVELFGLTL